jgi:hypothetical protein
MRRFFRGRGPTACLPVLHWQGATLRQDLDDDAAFYGKKLENQDIVTSGRSAAKSAAPLIALLNKYSAREC